jgi:hypothetical protein
LDFLAMMLSRFGARRRTIHIAADARAIYARSSSPWLVTAKERRDINTPVFW